MFDIWYIAGSTLAAFAIGVVGYLIAMLLTKSQEVRYGTGLVAMTVLGLLPAVMNGHDRIPGTVLALILFSIRMAFATKTKPQPVAE